MHEASIAQSILDIIKGRMVPYGVRAEAQYVTVRYGEFRNVDPDSLQFAFDSLRKDDVSTADCQLELEYVPAVATCESGHEFCPQAVLYFSCTTCGGGIKRLVRGEELDVLRVVIQTDEQQVSR
jgi:hydrogenase nickel incorporation protein HypA/HybF